MKVGSLVVCIDDRCAPTVQKPVKDRIYTVREFIPIGIVKSVGTNIVTADVECIYLEEIINPPIYYGVEDAYYASRFREVLPPCHIAAINELLAPKEQELETV